MTRNLEVRRWLSRVLAVVATLTAWSAAAGPAEDGEAAYDKKDWAACERLLVQAAEADAGLPPKRLGSLLYSAGCCAALAGHRDAAFALLERGVKAGFQDPKLLDTDADLASLRADKRWAGVKAAVDKQVKATRALMSDPVLHDELLALVKSDQEQREAVMASMARGAPPSKEAIDKVKALDAASTAKMKQVVASKGWPGKSMVGEDGARAAWLLVQHADADLKFQQECLTLLEAAVKKGEAGGTELAYLFDRIASHSGKKQYYGTQARPNAKGELELDPIEDAEHVDERRKALGLEPAAEYLKHMKESVRR